MNLHILGHILQYSSITMILATSIEGLLFLGSSYSFQLGLRDLLCENAFRHDCTKCIDLGFCTFATKR